MPLTVRRATPADAPHLVEYNRRMALETEGKALDPAVLAAGVAAVLADPHKGAYYVAADRADLVGQLMLTWEWSDWRNAWVWWIQSVYVRADWRRRGVFGALYAHVYEAARREPQVVGLRLYVERDNRAAQATYQKLGMREANYLLFEKSPL
jgi:ribosomal protein S18 acetylase RimI-like enzyme